MDQKRSWPKHRYILVLVCSSPTQAMPTGISIFYFLALHTQKRKKTLVDRHANMNKAEGTIFAKHTCVCILTGTAAISVGLSTVQSPLLPFLILLDCNKEKMLIYEAENQAALQRKTKTEGDTVT